MTEIALTAGARALPARALPIAATGVLLAAVTVVFVYNSGWGYDGLEYLVIARSLTEGYPFYTFVPSKSFGLYYVVAAYLMLPGTGGHLGISIFITLLLVLSAALAARTVFRSDGPRAAAIAAALVLLASIFMEQNFLLPEGLVFACGLLAAERVATGEARRRATAWVAAGALVGVGAAFKVVALFYFVALLVWSLLVARKDGVSGATALWRALALLSGLIVALAVPALYFWATGRLAAHLQWTYWFPAVDYPSTTRFADKLYTKLAWVWVVSLGALALSLSPQRRRSIYRDERCWLWLLMGGCGLLALLKSQSSHFVFPGAAFLLLFAAVVAVRFARTSTLQLRSPQRTALAALVIAACLGSAALYWPSSLRRLFGVESYAYEPRWRAGVQALAPAGSHVLFFNRGLRLYWIAGRYPNWPTLHTDLQATRLMRERPSEFLRALDDPTLAVVEFDPDVRSYGMDRRFFDSAEGQAFLTALHERLQRDFTRDHSVPPLALWVRHAAAAQRN